MAKLAVLKIIDGDFENGFRVTLRISEEGAFSGSEIEGYLPPAPMMPEQYENWQNSYRLLSDSSFRALQARKAQKTNHSILDTALELQNCINEWLNSGNREFQPIRDRLLETFSNNADRIRLMIQAKDDYLWRLPWHLWDVFERYSQVEVALGYPEYEPVPQTKPKAQVKILVILGDSPDINVQKDLELLRRRLPEADIFPLINPQKDQLNQQLWEQDWQILFFAGHSLTEETDRQGRFYINGEISLTISELKYGLRRAIDRGLRLTIFNSCDGLGLARDLADLQMPAIVVMRERVPDGAAQKFLEFFLKAFAEDRKYLYPALREARERLHGLAGEYPCADWLPVICQNPAEKQLNWQDFLLQKRSIKIPFRNVLLVSLAVTSVILGMRSLGILQLSELQAYDQLMRLRPGEVTDPRILVITVTEEDIQALKSDQRKSSLPDEVLDPLLKKLKSYQPRVIGSDIYREFPVEPKYRDLATYLQKSDRFFAVCEVSEPDGPDKKPGKSPPPEVPKNRLGFTDLAPEIDGIKRRHLLAMSLPKTSPCNTEQSLSLRVALRYLKQETIKLYFSPGQDLKIGSATFKKLEKNSGGYHDDLDASGYQVMLNYRAGNRAIEQVTLKQVLDSSIDPNLVKDRVVLIGTDIRGNDQHDTPYTRGQLPYKKMPGVVVHAHMVSQILSAVLDRRPLLAVLPKPLEVLWIAIWSLVGAVLAWRLLTKPIILGLAVAATLAILYPLCLMLLIQGTWLPIIPSALALVATGGIVAITAKIKTLNIRS